MAGSHDDGLIEYDRSYSDGDETVPDGEAAALQTIVSVIEHRVRAAAISAPARRNAHPKAHGCVRAEFRVLDSLPEEFRVGLFAVPRTYPAWIRFSNGSETPQNDKLGDGRGMAIKLMGVAQSRSTTQDFLLINNPTFFVRNAADYVSFQTASPQWRFFLPSLNPFSIRVHEALVARAITSRQVVNPLNSQYWSMTPYLFGGRSCKFSARPVEPLSPFVATDSKDFLRDNLARHLTSQGAVFDFMVQLRANPDEMPIEDPTIEWSERESAFLAVAQIVISAQGFEDSAQLDFCENLSFTPWHGDAAHRPLGGINRVRRTVYETISRVRHEINLVPEREPADP